MATRPQQVAILQKMASEINDALTTARSFQKTQIPRDQDNPNAGLVTLTAQQRQDILTDFDAQVALVKADGATL